jgi:hypothetical protein
MARSAARAKGLFQLIPAAMLAMMLVTSLLPQGWMPQRGADDRLTLVLCTTDGPQEISVALSDNDAGEPTSHQTKDRCLWALAQAAAILAEAPWPITPTGTLAALSLSAPSRHLTDTPTILRPEARGPPPFV